MELDELTIQLAKRILEAKTPEELYDLGIDSRDSSLITLSKEVLRRAESLKGRTDILPPKQVFPSLIRKT